jgi:hypothetical protein
MPWDVAFVVTNASDGSPQPGVAIVEATPQGTQLAVTDASGAARVTVDVDASAHNALYIAATRFSIQRTDQRATVTVYDQQVRTRVIAGLPPFPDGGRIRVQYTITDSSDGSEITGIPAIDPLTGTVLASNPSVELGTDEGPEVNVLIFGSDDDAPIDIDLT